MTKIEHSTLLQKQNNITVKKNREKVIAVVCPLFGASRIFYTELLAAIFDTAKKYEYEIVIVPIGDPSAKRSLKSHCPYLSELSGVILITCQVEGSKWLEECTFHNLPVVLVHDNIPVEKARGHSVVSYIRPRLDALEELVAHLVEDHQCRNISVVMVNPKNHAIRTEKLSIIQQAIRKGDGLPFSKDKHIFFIKDYSHSEGLQVTDEILDANPKTEAIMSLADITAMGILQRLSELGFRDQIRVTGFDNIEVSSYSDLTTVDQQLRPTGERALLDLHNALQRDAFAEFKTVTYIPTTLRKRGSCCFEPSASLLPRLGSRRRAIFCPVTQTTISENIRLLRHRIWNHKMNDFDTIKLLGSAPRFPDHITIVGTFSMHSEKLSEQMCSEIDKAVKGLQPFLVTTADLQYFPDMTLSISLTDESRPNLLELQKTIIPIIKRYRLPDPEPEFRHYLHGKEPKEVENTREFGEPFILDLYNPHITLASGLRNDEDYETILKLAKGLDFKGVTMTISELWLMEEEEIGGSWKAIRQFELDPSR